MQTAQQNRIARSWCQRPTISRDAEQRSLANIQASGLQLSQLAEFSCIHSQSQLDLHQPSIRRGIFAIPPQLTARSSWELYECDASILLQDRNVQPIPRASQMSLSSCRPEPQQPHKLSIWGSNCISIAKVFRLS